MNRKLLILALSALLTACGGGGGGIADTPQPGTSQCSADGQKEFVLEAMRQWYFWNANLPASVNLADFATPEELLAFLTTFSPDDGSGNPIDRFSFINSAQADQQFFGEGKFEGFGFSSRFDAADDLRITRVFMDSPAFRAGLARGQRILELNGRTIAEIEAAEGVFTVLDTTPVTFLLENPDTTTIDTGPVDQDIVTIAPVPRSRIIDDGVNPPVGYMELATFISTADPVFDTVFAEFVNQGVRDVIIDLRYNGGGLVSTANLLADYLGGFTKLGQVYTETRFNADRSSNNSIELFDDPYTPLQGLDMINFVIVASRSTASASEATANSLEPHFNVGIVGDRTFGKPVGQVGIEFCSKILRPTAFQTFNADGFGDYFDGLFADCAVPDDLNVEVGEDGDPNVEAALSFIRTGGCPVTVAPQKGLAAPALAPQPRTAEQRSRPEFIYLDAF
jgi:C-terminal processing protease CtpA/Prc